MAELLPFQEEGVRLIERFGGRALLADEMGLGKTPQALVWAGRANALPICVVTQASLKDNWVNETATWLGMRATKLNGTRPPEDHAIPHDSSVYVVNYTILPQWVDWLRARGIKHYVLDECQNINNDDSSWTAATRALVAGCRSLVSLSGTPMTNRPFDLWPILSMLRPDIWSSRFAFMTRYCKPKLTPRGWEAKGADNLQELNALLVQHCMIRRLKAQVLKDFPAKTRLTIPLPLWEEHLYKRAARDFLVWLKQYGRGGQVAKAKGNVALYQVGELIRLASRLKLRAGVAWVNEWLHCNPTEKAVIFTVNQPAWEVYMRRLQYGTVGINGATPAKTRQDIVNQFSHDPNTRVLVGNLKAAGVGLNMTKACTTIHAELWWAPYAHTQGEDRVHRIGQTRDCWAYYLVALGTIEEKIATALRTKQEIQDRSIDGLGGMHTGREVNLYENVLKEAVVNEAHLIQG